MNEYFYNNYPYKKFKKFKYVPRCKKDNKIVDVYISFDIETSTIKEIEQSFMYSWCIGINDTDIIRGTTWKQFLYTLIKIKSHSKPHDKYIIYVYNLDFEFGFLRGIYNFSSEEVFALEPHRILKCFMMNGTFEFRCAHKLVGIQLNLYNFMLQEKVPLQYLKTGFYDYDKIRFSDSKLKRHEKIYIRNDCIGLNIALKSYIESRGYNLRTVPLTITGFLRVKFRQEMRIQIGQNFFTERAPSEPLLIKLHYSFRGGNTHSNSLYIGKLLRCVYTYDIKSDYPAQLYYKKFPVTPFKEVLKEDYKEVLYNTKLAKLIKIVFSDIRLKDFFTAVPYIPISKCMGLTRNCVVDNGRLRSCDDPFVMWLTDIDFNIISKQYDFSFEIMEVYASVYDFLPEAIRNFVFKIFEGKETIDKDAVEYKIYKGLLNSIYGDFVMYPLKPELLYRGETYDIQERDNKYYDKYIKKNTKLYQWGVWCTALARQQLQDMIDAIPFKDFVYCDTDSIKFIGEHNFSKFENYNKENFDTEHLKLGWYTEDKPFRYDSFKTFGAKKYAYEVNGKIHITVAGVPKSGAQELVTLDDFKLGKVFEKTGKKRIKHNENYGQYNIKNHDVYIRHNICLIDTEYKLDITDDLKDLATEIFIKIKRGIKNENY